MNCPSCQIAYDPGHWEICPHCGAESDTGEEPGFTELSGVLRTSTILIAAGDRSNEFYRSLDEVPAPLRHMLVKSTSGLNSGVIYIADQRGREQITPALRELPKAMPDAPVFERLARPETPQPAVCRRRRVSISGVWLLLMLAAFAGALVWLFGSRGW